MKFKIQRVHAQMASSGSIKGRAHNGRAPELAGQHADLGVSKNQGALIYIYIYIYMYIYMYMYIYI